MRKNHKLLTIFLTLATLNIALLFLFKENNVIKESNNDKPDFHLESTEGITQISMISDTLNVMLSKANNKWLVNNNYELDPNMKAVLFSVLKDVRVQRAVNNTQKKKLASQGKINGTHVKIMQGDKILRDFFAFGDANNQRSYFLNATSEEPYLVHLPGYESYVTGIFGVNPNDWRNRYLIKSTWETIKEISINNVAHPQEEIKIKADGRLFSIDGVANLNTEKMMAYIEGITNMQAIRFINKPQNLGDDKLIMSIKIDDAQQKNNCQIEIFAFADDKTKQYLLVKNKSTYAIIDQNTLNGLIQNKQAFEQEKN
ncbi:hypothetical protein [Aureibacter tunicatorum]|uniref:DUF4340 domain-containing protein n=1 Tax=Aureibacter tunicatorum TaxID=866807 RepID=A0AAE3XSU4_9BACT|nr:hypothetical protein [Aureibacter tunicatorum]MDR6241246.1 hypothetical protein [Aureibacter tunicatorum]BDD03506.1 hypothetical protein AUTU_09890 [Aureibacter tunicatorum]